MKWTAPALVAFLALQPLVLAQAPVIKAEKPVTATFTIQAIDQTDRLITLRDDKGTDDIFYAGTAHLTGVKPGDRIDITYTQAALINVLSTP